MNKVLYVGVLVFVSTPAFGGVSHQVTGTVERIERTYARQESEIEAREVLKRFFYGPSRWFYKVPVQQH